MTANMNDDSPMVYTVEEAAEILGIGRNQAYEGVHSGEIPSFRIGRLIKIPKAGLEKLLSNFKAPQKEIHPEILRLHRIKMHEPTVSITARISVELNNKLVKSAMANGNTMSHEVSDRLNKSFEET